MTARYEARSLQEREAAETANRPSLFETVAGPKKATPPVPAKPRRRRKAKTKDGDDYGEDVPNSLRYKTGSRDDPFPRSDGRYMVKTTFSATWEFDRVLLAYSATLCGEPRNAWIERVLLGAIEAEMGKAWIDGVIRVAQKSQKKAEEEKPA